MTNFARKMARRMMAMLSVPVIAVGLAAPSQAFQWDEVPILRDPRMLFCLEPTNDYSGGWYYCIGFDGNTYSCRDVTPTRKICINNDDFWPGSGG